MGHKGTADRVRPMLEAMERSIVEARNRRTGRPQQPRPINSFNGSDHQESDVQEQPVRLKARPKRR